MVSCRMHCFLVGHFILIVLFVSSTNICNHFYFVSVANVNYSHSFSFSPRKSVVLLLVVFLFQVSQLFMDKRVHKSAASHSY